MKQVPIDALLETPSDGVTYQTEWTMHGQQGRRAVWLEIALFAGAVGPGLFVVAAWTGLRLGLLAGYLIVAAGYALPHLLFLGRIERFWRGMLRPGRSWISRGFLFANLFMVFGLLSVAHYVPGLDRGPLAAGSSGWNAIVQIAAVSAVLLATYPGFLFSTLRAIPFWQSAALVPLFLVQGLAGGAALAMLIAAAQAGGAAVLAALVFADFALLLISAALFASHLALRWRAGEAGQASVRQMVSGKYRNLFLIGALPGLVLPVVLLVVALPAGWPAAALSAAPLQLLGILLLKYCILNVGAYSPVFNPRLLRRAGTKEQGLGTGD